MKIYTSAYSWNVRHLLREGKVVYMLDKEQRKVFNVSEMPVGLFMEIEDAEDDNRYEFWYEEEVKQGE